nr:bifunctional diguanylate cyclase/phosphodiesterase [Motilibacter deserti]
MSPGGSTAVALASIYALVALLASFFFRYRLTLLHLALALAACAAACLASGGVGLAEYFLVVGQVLITSATVGWLVRVAAESEIDPLTGLANKRGLDRALESSLARASAGHGERAGLVLAVIDLDYFKTVNDTAGHATGDRLLRACADAWSGLLGDGQLLARVGGDEFVLLLPGLDRAAAVALVERLRAAVPGRTSTVGLAEWEHGDSSAMLLARADAALYAGKRNGRNQASWHATATHGLSEPLAAALDRGDLQVHYQPLVDLASGAVRGAEALLRWPDGEGGWVSPATFIPVAEANGLIHRLGAWALHRACADAQAWSSRGLSLEKLSVNVSPLQLQDAGFGRLVQKVLADTGFDPGRLVLEVTESAVGAEDATAYRTLSDLRARGVRIAIDDFGTGYSTLSRLRDVPVDVLKVDRSFVATLGDEGSHTSIVGAVIALAGALGLSTVAEGIERPAQAELLRALGCTEGQGFLYSPAVPADAFVATAGSRAFPAHEEEPVAAG